MSKLLMRLSVVCRHCWNRLDTVRKSITIHSHGISRNPAAIFSHSVKGSKWRRHRWHPKSQGGWHHNHGNRWRVFACCSCTKQYQIRMSNQLWCVNIYMSWNHRRVTLEIISTKLERVKVNWKKSKNSMKKKHCCATLLPPWWCKKHSCNQPPCPLVWWFHSLAPGEEWPILC